MKLYKFKTMIYVKHSIKYVAGILWNSINVDIKIQTMYFKRKIRNWQGPIFQCGQCLICILWSVNLTLLHLSSVYIPYFHWCLLHFSYYHTSWTQITCVCVNCLYCLPCKIKIVLLCVTFLHYPNKYQIKKLQAIQKTTARLVANSYKYVHITTILLKHLHLPVQQRINFKIFCSSLLNVCMVKLQNTPETC